jgi:RNA polymerase sigma-70 factor (ECF subfamily)
LLRRHVNGDPHAFGALFLRHRDRLWAVAVRTLHDNDEAADALQDAMISAFRQAAAFRGDSAVTTWLHRIVVNACLDRMRRRAARPAVTGLDEDAMDALAATTRGAAEQTDATETSIEVTAALRLLPAEQRAALVLVDMLGYSVADAAGVLGVAAGTVKSRCARGRARLLPLLSHLRLPASVPPVPSEPDVASRPVVASEPVGPSESVVAAGEFGERNQTSRRRVSPAEGGGDSRL